MARLARTSTKQIIGQRFGRWEVLESAPDVINRIVMVRCRCDCGTIKDVNRGSILAGSSKSCGCLAKEKQSKARKTHGQSNNRIYNIWNATVNNSKEIPYPANWETFEGFYAEMGEFYEQLASDVKPDEMIAFLRNDQSQDFSRSNCYFMKKGKRNGKKERRRSKYE